MSAKTFAIAAIALFAVPCTSHAAKRVGTKVSARAPVGLVAPLARVFVAVRHGSSRTVRNVLVTPAPGKANRNVTVRAYRVSTGQEVFKKIATVTPSSPIRVKLDHNPTVPTTNSTDVQLGQHQYIISVTAGTNTYASRSSTRVLGKGVKVCRTGSLKWFDGSEILTPNGKTTIIRPKTDPWPKPDPEAACRH